MRIDGEKVERGTKKTPSHAVVNPVKSLHESDAVQSRGRRGKCRRGYRAECVETSTAYGLSAPVRSSFASRPKPAMSTECKDPGPLPKEMSEEA